MKLTIVYDNEIYKNNPGNSDHGFSCFIETEEKNILFDTGTNGKTLLENMNLLSIDPSTIDTIVISHEHYDHSGGLKELISYLDKTIIYRLEVTPSNSNIIEKKVEKPIKIAKHIFSTGRLTGTPVDEQSLLLETKNGIVVLTGCSHPGVRRILQTAETKGNIIGLIGGFHGFSDYTLLQSLQFVYPCHCTRYKNKIKKKYPKAAFNCGVGLYLKI